MASDPRAPFLSILFSAWSGGCHGQLAGGGGTTAGHLAGVRAHQRVSVQPSSGCAMVLEPSRRAAAGARRRWHVGNPVLWCSSRAAVTGVGASGKAWVSPAASFLYLGLGFVYCSLIFIEFLLSFL